MSRTTTIGLSLIILNIAALLATWIATGVPPSEERFGVFGSLLLSGMGLIVAQDQKK